MKRIIRLYILVAALMVFGLIPSRYARAADLCGQDESRIIYDSIIQLPSGDYTAYVKLNRLGQEANAELSVSSAESLDCPGLGSAHANADSWVPLGTLTAQGTDLLSVRLALDDAYASQDASSPAVMFVPVHAPPCPDVNVCTVQYLGSDYMLNPQKISLNSDTLRAALLQSMDANASIRKTIFYANDVAQYSVNGKSASFDHNYIGPGEYVVKTVLVMSDGQTLTQSESYIQKLTIHNLLASFYLHNRTTIWLVLVFAVLMAISLTVLWYLRRKDAASRWEMAHVATVSQNVILNGMNSAEVFAQLQKENARKKEIKMLVAAIAVPVSLLAMFVLVNNFVIARFTVDGVSMEPTLHNRSQQWYLRLPITIASFNRTLPKFKRGDVVVIRHDDNNLFIPAEEIKQSYVVKRIIGLPGDRVVVRDGSIRIINLDNTTGFVPDDTGDWKPVIVPSEGRQIDITLKEGEVFVAGDDREFSIDSRYYGPIKSSDIVGKVLYKRVPGLQPYKDEEFSP